MPRRSFENQGEKMMYEQGRKDALEEIFRSWYDQLRERDAFPDANESAFAEWGLDVLIPEIRKYRGQDDLFEQLMDI